MKVNLGTKKAQELMHDMTHKYYRGTTLFDCYKSVSSAKVRSWNDIVAQCEALNGERLHITSASSHQYSCMYAYPVINEETGEITDMVLRKETSCNTYDLTLPIDEYRALMGGE